MTRDELRELLLPVEPERDPQFARQIAHLSVIGLRVVAFVCLGSVFYFAAAAIFVPMADFEPPGGVVVPISILLLGLAAVTASFYPPAAKHARLAGMCVGYGVAVAQMIATAPLVDNPEVAYLLMTGVITGVMLVGTAALPMKPVHALALGSAILVTYAVALPALSEQAVVSYWVVLVHGGQSVVLCALLNAVVYRQRVLAFRARRSAQDALHELRGAQAKLLVSENAHSQSRFAAALSHELNTPLGALTSAFDTLLAVFRKAGMSEDARYSEVVRGAEAAGRGSAGRLHSIVERMSYLTNLDRAEVQEVDVNELCRQTVELLDAELSERAQLRLALGDVPALRCQPQQVAAVLSNLLRNAAAAVSETGRIELSTSTAGDTVKIEVRDNGRGMSPDRLATLFEPSFRVEGGRVATSNWSLFVCRMIVVEHGGELEIESVAGKGTVARMHLPSRPEGYRTKSGSAPTEAEDPA